MSITADSYGDVVTLVKPFTDGTALLERGVVADNSLLAGKTLVPLRRGDVNLDGMVTIADVTTLVNIILGKPVGSNDDVIDVGGSGGIEYGGGGSGPAHAPRTHRP